MENVIKFEVIDEIGDEANSIFTTETCNSITEIADTELDQSGVNVDADKQQNMDVSSDCQEKVEDIRQGLFGPFSHCMKPNLELIRLESERSALNQEAATKLIKDRYKWIMEIAARRKEKEQKNSIKSTQLPHYKGIEDIKKTTQLLHNMHLTPGSLTKDQSEEFSDNHLDKVYWHGVLNRFIKLNYGEISTKTNIPSMDVLNTVTEHPECKVEDPLRHTAYEQTEIEKTITFTQLSQKHEAIGSSFEELLDESFENQWEL